MVKLTCSAKLQLSFGKAATSGIIHPSPCWVRRTPERSAESSDTARKPQKSVFGWLNDIRRTLDIDTIPQPAWQPQLAPVVTSVLPRLSAGSLWLSFCNRGWKPLVQYETVWGDSYLSKKIRVGIINIKSEAGWHFQGISDCHWNIKAFSNQKLIWSLPAGEKLVHIRNRSARGWTQREPSNPALWVGNQLALLCSKNPRKHS